MNNQAMKLNITRGACLRERIARASSIEELKKLAEMGKTFLEVSEKTKRQWVSTAFRRMETLAGKGKAK